MIFLENVGFGDDRPEKQCLRCKQWWPASHLDTDTGDCITCEDSPEPSIYDLDIPDFATVDDNGIWCSFCGNLMVASFHTDEKTTCPEECSQCGAPDPEAMAEHFI